MNRIQCPSCRATFPAEGLREIPNHRRDHNDRLEQCIGSNKITLDKPVSLEEFAASSVGDANADSWAQAAKRADTHDAAGERIDPQ